MLKQFKSAILLPAVLLLSLTGCLERQFAESEAVLSPGVEEIVVPADMYEGPGLVADTLVVTSNRSWAAALQSNVDWVEIGTDESLNISQVMEDVRIPLKFKDNDTESARSVVLRLTSEAGYRDVTIRQKAIRYRLALSEGSDSRIVAGKTSYESSVICEPDTCVLCLNSNTAWTARILEGNTADVKLDVTSGEGIGKVKVIFGENEDPDSGKQATVVVSADGCDDIRVAVNQAVGTPYVKFISTDFDNINVPSIGARVTFTVKSNVAWSMKVKDGETLQAKFQVKRKTSSGTDAKDDAGRQLYDYLDEYVAKKGEKTVTAAIFGNTDFDADKTIIFQMNAEGAVPAEKAMTVDKLSKVFLSFRKWPDVYSDTGTSSTYYQPFNMDMYGSSKCMTNNAEWECWNGYKFKMHTFGTLYPAVTSPTARMCVNSAAGLNLGTSYNMIEIGLPAVPGKRIAKVTLMNGASSTSQDWLRFGVTSKEYADKVDEGFYPTQRKFSDKDGDGKPYIVMVTGGEDVYFAPPTRRGTYENPADDMAKNEKSFHTFELNGSEKGVSYALVSPYATGIKWIEIIYE